MQSIRILIVEDETIVAKSIERKLQSFGYIAAGMYSSGEEAIIGARENHPELILMDIQLQGKLDGIEAAAIICAEHNVPVVFLTSYSDQKTLERAKLLQPAGYILKPFDDRELRTTIEMASYKFEMDQRLKESEERYREISELVSDCAISLHLEKDGTTDIEWSTESFDKLFRIEKNQKNLTTEWGKFFDPVTAMRLRPSIEKFLIDKKPLTIEFPTTISEKNQLQWIRMMLKPVVDEKSGRLVRVIIAGYDITERRLAEEALHHRIEVEKLISSIFRQFINTPGSEIENEIIRSLERLGIFTQTDGCFVGIYKIQFSTIEKLFRWKSGHESSGRTDVTSIDLSHYTWVRGKLHQGQPVIIHSMNDVPIDAVEERSILHSSCIQSALVVPIRLNDEYAGFLGFLMQKEERTWTEGDIAMLEILGDAIGMVFTRKQVEEQFRKIWELSFDGMRVIDERGIIIMVNKAYCKLIGIDETQLVGRPFSHVYETKNRDSMLTAQLRMMADGTLPLNMERQLSMWDRTIKWFEISNSFLERDQSNVKVLSIFRDITRKKETEEALRNAQKNESISVLAGGVAHDYNNLLVAMLGQTSLALSRLEPDHPVRSNLEKALRSAERAADLTKQLLAYAGGGKFEVKSININMLLKENFHLFEIAHQRNTQIDLQLNDPIPFVKADPGQMQQVVMNLVINSSEAIGEKRGEIIIRTGIQVIRESDSYWWRFTGEPLPPGEYIAIDVLDNGSGMDPKIFDKIFDPFFSTKFTGRGLGLAAVFGIIRSHKGGIHVESEIGKGTTFKFILPAIARESHERKKSESAAPIAARKVILFVDDDESVREAVAAMFDEQNIPIVPVEDGMQAINIFKERRNEIAFVLLDYAMPGMNGREVMGRLREIDPSVRVILTSGYSEEEIAKQFEAMNLTGFIQKPYSLTSLMEEIKRYL